MGNSLTQAPGAAGRIQYIDAMRGFTMVLVVLAHVLLFMSPRHWDGSPAAAVLLSFRMPLFFFISGYFAYKAVARWTASVVSDIMIRKLRAQVLCATLFFMLFAYVNHTDVFDFAKTGYGFFWFTIALFQMFVVYVALNLISRAIRRNIVDVSLIVLGCLGACFGLEFFPVGICTVFSWHQVIHFFPFFAAGILCREHADGLDRLLRQDWFRTLVTVVFVAGCFKFYAYGYRDPHSVPAHLLQGVAHRFSGLFTVLIFFHSRAAFFSGTSRLAVSMRFIGTRTLDIYMMHMFFMPHLAQMGWFASLGAPSMVVFKLGVTVPVALAIVGLCLLCSSVLRSSHFLSVWLWGVRNRPRVPRIQPRTEIEAETPSMA